MLPRNATWANIVEAFIDSTIASDDPPAPEDYLPGTQRLNFYAELFDREDRIYIEDDAPRYQNYELALESRLHTNHSSPLVIIGGIGAGKTSCLKHIIKRLSDQTEGVSSPLLFDAISAERNDSLDEIIRRLYREVCNISLAQLARRAHGPVPQDDRIASRTLLLCNDVYRWSINQDQRLIFPFRPNIPKEFRLNYMSHTGAPSVAARLSSRPELIEEIRSARQRLSLSDYHKLCQCSLAFFVDQSSSLPLPYRTLIVDNVDQLATNDIQELFAKLRSLKNEIPGIEIIVPLRPSSVASGGYTRNTTFIYHYGPNCFDMMLGRCLRHVLEQPRNKVKDTAFSNDPSDDDVTLLIVATHIYACLLSSGAKSHTADFTKRYHKDHTWVKSLDVLTDGRGQMVSNILGALVGTCARYAIRHASRFYSHAGQRRSILLEYAKSARAAYSQNSRRPKVRFGFLVDSALAITSRIGPNADHCINIYRPTRTGPNREWPSLSMLRVLFLLLQRKERVLRCTEIISELAKYGIPGEVTLEAIDELRMEDRHLCWINSNQDSLSLVAPDDLKQKVTISEQGAEYARSLAGNFEYVWLCGRDLQQRDDYSSEFSVRLEYYRNLIRQLLATEWKQITFFLSSKDRLPVWNEVSIDRYLITLRIAFKTTANATMGIVRSAIRRSRQLYENERPLEGPHGYLDRLNPVLTEMLECIGTAIMWHAMAFGHRGFRVAYSAELERFQSASLEFRKQEMFRGLNAFREFEILADLINTFPVNVRLGRPPSTAIAMLDSRLIENPDIVSKTASALYYLPNALGGGIGKNAGNAERLEIEKESYTSTETELRTVFRQSFPTFMEVLRRVSKLRRQADAVTSAWERHGVEVNKSTYVWYRKAGEQWRKFESELEHASYTTESKQWSISSVTNAKKRHNRLLRVYVEIATSVGAPEIGHLNTHWTEGA